MSSEPQSCTKCGSLPEDILMLACSHDLCLDCAAERLALESKKKPATGIVCEFCNERTQLDSESIYELEKIMLDLQSRRAKKDPAAVKTESRRVEKYDRPARSEKRTEYPVGEGKPPSNYDYPKEVSSSLGKSPLPATYLGSDKKNCTEHPEEELLYYCFECNCQCICPECVIHGKHKNHDVKTLRKSQPIVKGRLQNMLESIQANIDGLAVKKTEFEKHIRQLTQQNNVSKKQIQKAFNDLRQRISTKENEILAKCDKALEMTVEEYERGIKGVMRKIEEIKNSSQSIIDSLKRDELTLLNFYARRSAALQELVKRVDLDSFVREDANRVLANDATLKGIGQLSDEISEMDIDSNIKYDPKYDQPRAGSKFAEREYEPEHEYQRPARDTQKARDYLRKY